MHKSIGKNESWSIDIIGGVIEIESKTNTHFVRAHPEIYYTEYPGRVKLQTVQEEGL